MIEVEGKQYRNLEEQVLFNSNRINSIIQGNIVLGELGIKVVGNAPSAASLPDPATYSGQYGDAYLIGAQEPFDFYIFTRPFQGELFPKWFNLGEFPVPGPVGPVGPSGGVGQRGEKGSGIFPLSDYVAGQTAERYENGDLGIVYSGNYAGAVLYVINGVWQDLGTVRGPQGVQGPVGPAGPQGIQGPIGERGPQGLTGESIEVLGEVANVDALPDPSSVERNQAVIATVDGSKHLFIVAGEGDNIYWLDTGPAGIQGPAGADGLPGETGPQGPQGPQGPAGQAATVRVGTVTTGAAGSQASVVNSGTEYNAVLDFKIPQGEKGEVGSLTAVGYSVSFTGFVSGSAPCVLALLRASSEGVVRWTYYESINPSYYTCEEIQILNYKTAGFWRVTSGRFFSRLLGQIYDAQNPDLPPDVLVDLCPLGLGTLTFIPS